MQTEDYSFDLNSRTDVKNLKTNKIESLSVKDITERNLTKLLRTYNTQVLGLSCYGTFWKF